MNKPNYSFDHHLFCGIIDYNNKKYFMDIDDRDAIINYSKKFFFQNENDLYPSYNFNEQKINYLIFLYNFKEINVKYVFKNGNPLDLRRCNVECHHMYHYSIIAHYNIVEYIPGHCSKNGVDPYSMKNPMWKILENDKEYMLMYCEKETIIKLCSLSYQKILDFEKEIKKKLTWYKSSNGYIQSHNPNDAKNYYIHQIITGCYGNGKGTKNISVDHIDQNPLNNSWGNLRIATREEQEQNCKGIKEGTKRERKKSAKPLPEGITQEMFRKYVVYYHEWLNLEKTRSREFFKIEKHPKSDKIIIGTKSNNVSILDKLVQINKIVDELG
jgi:hypothetical protein